MSAPYDRPAIAFINHLLDQQAWARTRLQPFAGRSLQVRVQPIASMRARITAAGRLEPVAGETFDLSIGLRAGMLPALLRHDAAAMQDIALEGDTELAAVVRLLFRELRWDAEEDLALLVGDIAAHRIAESGRALLAWPRDGARRLGENLSEYLREEAALLVPRAGVDCFLHDVETLRDRVARLEKRLQRLQPPVPPAQD